MVKDLKKSKRSKNGKSTLNNLWCKLKNIDFLNALIYVLIAVLIGLITYLLVQSIRNNNKETDSEGFMNKKEYLTNVAQPAEYNSNMKNYFDPENEVLIIYSFMASCPHCKNFDEQVWNKTVDNLTDTKREDGKKLKMMRVDPDHELSLDVRGFPTIRKVEDTTATEFVGPRNVESFTNFCMN